MTMIKIKNNQKKNLFSDLKKELNTNYDSNLIYKTYFKKNKKINILDVPNSNLIFSSVLCLFSVFEDIKSIKVILTLRSRKLKSHANQISFPGGKMEEKDGNYENCAIRETYEEIGINSKDIEIIGRTNKYTTGTGFLIQPIVARLKKRQIYKINTNEVQKVITFPMEYLFLNKNLTLSHFVNNINKKKFFYYDIKWSDIRIWGATAMILIDLSNSLKKIIKKNV